MNSSPSLYNDNETALAQPKHPYYDWVSANFPLLSSQSLEQEYTRKMLQKIASSQIESLPQEAGSTRSIILVDCTGQIYRDLRAQCFEQFARLCASARQDDELGAKAREFLAYFVLSDGYPAYTEQRQELADYGALALRQLMNVEKFRPDFHPAVSGIIGYSQSARASIRLIMLDAFGEYFSAQTQSRPGRQELSSIIYEGLKLELRRPLSEQSVEFQERLIQILIQHPHPATIVLLSVVAAEHSDESLKKRARESLRQLQDSLSSLWETTTADQVSGEEFRARCLSEIEKFPLSGLEQIQAIYNACKGLKIVHLSDPRLAQLHRFMLGQSDTIRLASAIALSNIYALEAACEVATAAIEVLTDWAVNGEDGRYVLDALNAVKHFESISNDLAKKVEIAYLAANQKFISRSAMNKVH